MAALSKKVEPEFEIRTGIAEKINLTDSELLTRAIQIIETEFNVKHLSQLSHEQTIRLSCTLRRNYGTSVSQLARVLKISPEIINSVI